MSRGLDAQIARDVFGWTDIQLREDVGAIGIPPRDEDGHTVPFWVEKCYFYIVPEYSSKPELAQLVLAKMFRWYGPAREVFLDWYYDGLASGSLIDQDGDAIPWDYPTEEHARRICVQALLAISLERMEGNDGK